MVVAKGVRRRGEMEKGCDGPLLCQLLVVNGWEVDLSG